MLRDERKCWERVNGVDDGVEDKASSGMNVERAERFSQSQFRPPARDSSGKSNAQALDTVFYSGIERTFVKMWFCISTR